VDAIEEEAGAADEDLTTTGPGAVEILDTNDDEDLMTTGPGAVLIDAVTVEVMSAVEMEVLVDVGAGEEVEDATTATVAVLALSTTVLVVDAATALGDDDAAPVATTASPADAHKADPIEDALAMSEAAQDLTRQGPVVSSTTFWCAGVHWQVKSVNSQPVARAPETKQEIEHSGRPNCAETKEARAAMAM